MQNDGTELSFGVPYAPLINRKKLWQKKRQLKLQKIIPSYKQDTTNYAMVAHSKKRKRPITHGSWERTATTVNDITEEGH